MLRRYSETLNVFCCIRLHETSFYLYSPTISIRLTVILKRFWKGSFTVNHSRFYIPSFNVLLRLERSEFGVLKVGVHSFNTYEECRILYMKMNPAIHDIFFLCTQRFHASKISSFRNGMSCIWTDDTLSLCNIPIFGIEAFNAKMFCYKSCDFIPEKAHLLLNGSKIDKGCNEHARCHDSQMKNPVA